jgi:hypothetical protein
MVRLLLAVDLVEVAAHQRRDRLRWPGRARVPRPATAVLEREVLGAGLEEEVERVVDRHLDHQVDRDLEFGGLLGEDQPRLVVGERVLLPVDEVVGGLDLAANTR